MVILTFLCYPCHEGARDHATAYSYVRFSQLHSSSDSLRRQLQLSEAYAERHGLTIDTTLHLRDLGVSAFRGKNVKEGALAGFMEAIRLGKVKRGSCLLLGKSRPPQPRRGRGGIGIISWTLFALAENRHARFPRARILQGVDQQSWQPLRRNRFDAACSRRVGREVAPAQQGVGTEKKRTPPPNPSPAKYQRGSNWLTASSG